MPNKYLNTTGINTYINPLLQDGQLIHCNNFVSFPFGAKTKRAGFSLEGTINTGTVTALWNFPRSDGTTYYGQLGSLVYCSNTGFDSLGTIVTNGTVSATTTVGYSFLGDTMVIGDGVGSTKYSTNGGTFVDMGLAPIAKHFEQYQNRIYAMGTASTIFYSTTNDATNWNTSGTSDSSSFTVPGAGRGGKIFKTADQLIIPKTSGLLYKWDGYQLIDMSTNYGPQAQYSLAKSEDYYFYVNSLGINGYGGAKPKLLSNAIQGQFYSDGTSGVFNNSGYNLGTIIAECYRYDYLASVGTITDGFVNRTLANGIIKYDFQKNEFLNWSLGTAPTAFFTDLTGAGQEFYYGDRGGNVWKYDKDAYSDNTGRSIPCELIMVFHYGEPEFDKNWNYYRGIFNPGCEARVQVSCSNTYNYTNLKWQDLGDCTSGVVEYKFTGDRTSKFLFVRIYESSTVSRTTYYGCSIDAKVNFIQ